MGEKPRPDYSLDRIDPTRGYEPGNVRWATPYEQSCNTRRSLPVLLRGEKVTSAEACRRLNVSDQSVKKARAEGFPPHEAIALAAVRKKLSQKQVTGEFVDWSTAVSKIQSACDRLGLTPHP
jgi:hypothetical protein